jgi:hypothetical protein
MNFNFKNIFCEEAVNHVFFRDLISYKKLRRSDL